jgi:dipeptidyl-peptidase-4
LKRLLAVLVVLISVAGFGQEKKPLTIEAIFAEGSITGRGPEALKWSPDGSKLSFVQRDDAGEHGQLWYIDAGSGEKKVLVSEEKLVKLSPPVTKITDEREKERRTRYAVSAYHWAPDSKRILFDSNGQLWLYGLESGTAVQFTSSQDPSNDPKFSPDGKHVAFGRKHNLFVRAVEGDEERQLTHDRDEALLNGEVDWVYAEELDVRSNYFWSPDSRQIAFLQMDETRVPTYPITDWMPTHAKVDNQKYPQVGDPNPTVRLGVVGAGGGRVKWIKLTDDADTYVPRFGWVRNGMLWAEVLNRAQDHVDLYFIEANSGVSRKVLSESSDAWINVNDDFRILKSGDRFLWSSWRDGHTHLYVYRFDPKAPLSADAKLERQITHGEFEALRVEGIDEVAETVFVTTNEGDPRQQHVYSVKLDGTESHRLTPGDGTERVTFAPDGKHFTSSVSSTLNPPRLSFCSAGGACNAFWEARSVSEYGLVEPKEMEFRAEDGTTLYGQLTLPSSTGGKIPLLVYVYGGPAGQTASQGWGGSTFLFHQRLVHQGIAVFTVDNRGTPERGKKFSAALRGQFGGVELRDQLAALQQLLGQYPLLDKDRIAIWGWSNGGSMTLYAMTHCDVFRAGVAVAPVTDQRNYDSIYTERYMGLLKDNAKGYEGSAIPKVANNLHGSLLLVHGTSDDNVHPQNSIQMIDALIKAGKQFRLMLYPNKTHGIAGPTARTHLFHMIEDHLERELK